jgi:hypothetical protein
MRRPHDLRAPVAHLTCVVRAARVVRVVRVVRVALMAAVPALAGCDGCHGAKPYTPYKLSEGLDGSAHVDVAPGAASDAGPLDAGGFVPVAGTTAPGDGKTWPLEGGVVEPPAGHTFGEGLVGDVDGDGTPDLVAWSRSPDGLRGEVWFASGKAPTSGRTVVALPGDLAGPGCTTHASFTRLGPAILALDVDPRCPARGRDRGARWIAILRLSAGAPELGLELRIAAPADGETIAVALDGRDRDGDGRGDLTVTLTLSGAPRPLPGGGSAAATLAYFDRPAGLSRDPSEPEASLKSLATGLVAEGRKRTTAPKVASAALAARGLWALLCDEGRQLVTTSAGPARCGDAHVIEDAAMAETEAALNLGDPVGAIAALSRVEGRRKDLEALVAKSVPSILGRLVRTTACTPALAPAPAYGPIAFDKAGDLLVRTKDRILRVDRTSFEERPIDAAIRWPTRLAAPGEAPAWTLTAVEEPCDAPTLIGRFETGGSSVELPLPILAPARCTAGARVPVDLLGASSQGGLFAVRGDVVAVPFDAPPKPVLAEAFAAAPGAPVELGAARSPEGSVIALMVARGALVAKLKGAARGASARLWTAPALDEAAACVPNDAADRIACAVKDAVAIYDAQ